MNKEFILHSADKLTVSQLYWIAVASSSKAVSDFEAQLEIYKAAKVGYDSFSLAQDLTEPAYCQGIYLKIAELLADAIEQACDKPDEKDDPSEFQFSDWSAISEVGQKIRTLIDLLPD